MATLEETLRDLEDEYCMGWLDNRSLGALVERAKVAHFLRAEAINGTADFEFKVNKLADAIERGDHEH
jgi:hypothetical protein